MGDSNPSFTFINYEICMYCTNLVKGEHRDGYRYGCKLVQDEKGRYVRLTWGNEQARLKSRGIDSINSLVGCNNLSPNGVPVHPSIRDKLIKRNSKFKEVPVDENTTETSWDFDRKVTEALESLGMKHTSYDKIQ